ncbi:hypothetical protein SAMN05421837_104450 [Amycolatopsis pretoriensis]|uniref:DUF1453 domain-containing protein n=1 Tax=Amycolatopsis pretoriensis TaxID=218821 RepID=A0A1H5QSF6_9PSEU|nr:hypothetical protein [Amycolatopsis pretoriensis]SEF28979.1 hypothetical protein SAMN05421837_104450 [Amycolatopsis pretoriensis]
MPSAANVLLYVAIAAYVFYRVVYKQVRGTLLNRRTLTVMPLILVAVGGYLAAKALPGSSAGELGLLAADLVLLAGLGVLRSTTTTLTPRDGTTFQKGSAITIGLWVLTIAVRVGLAALGTALGVAGPLTTASIALTLGVSIAVQNATTYLRIQRRGLPLADQRPAALSR